MSVERLRQDNYQPDPDCSPSTNDLVGLYLKEATKAPLLTTDQEVELAKQIEAGRIAGIALLSIEQSPDGNSDEHTSELARLVAEGAAAEERFILANTRLVVSIAKKHLGQGLPFLDLIQEGNIALVRAVDGFEYWRGHKFSVYARLGIRREIIRAINSEKERRGSVAEPALSLDYEDPDFEEDMYEYVTDPNSPTPEEEMQRRMAAEALGSALGKIEASDRQLLRAVFGLDGEAEEIPQKGRERQRMVYDALSRLRRTLHTPALREHLKD